MDVMAYEIEKVLDASKATPELWAALVKAQGDIATVGKDGTNTQRGYQYSTADAMLAAGRTVMSANGLAMLSTWEAKEPGPATGDIGNQHVAARVLIWFVVGHASGGVIQGCATMDAIGSKARPPDKAVAAAVTFGLGFVMRGLLNIDRGEEDADAVDRRQEPEPVSPALRELMRVTTALQHLRGISESAARGAVKDRAKLWPDYPNDQEAARLTETARALIEEAKAPKPTTDRPAHQQAWATAARAYVDSRVADYFDAHGENPSTDLAAGINNDAVRISCEAADLAKWSTKDATENHCRLAMVALQAATKGGG